MTDRQNQAQAVRSMRKLLRSPVPESPQAVCQEIKRDMLIMSAWALMIGMVVTFLVFMAGCAAADTIVINRIDLGIIAKIESSNDPGAFNRHSGAVGLYQITPICLKDYNANHDDGYYAHYTMNEMYNEQYAFNVADWYLNERIPFYLNHYHIKDTIKNRLWAYNAGILNVKRGRMPKETVNYIKKYNDMVKKG